MAITLRARIWKTRVGSKHFAPVDQNLGQDMNKARASTLACLLDVFWLLLDTIGG